MAPTIHIVMSMEHGTHATRRYKEERRLAAMVMLAERQRRMREASPALAIKT